MLGADGQPDQTRGDAGGQLLGRRQLAWVVDAGWMTSDRTSPMFARLVNSSSASVNVCPASTPPLISNATIGPPPRGEYFCCWAFHGLDASDG